MSRRPPVDPNAGRVPAGALGPRPLVAIVGRPNVGKSTLFNRLSGQRLAIVEDLPGVTRDRNYAGAWALGKEYVLVDTGGFDPESDDPMRAGIATHVQLAIEECDVVLCVLDATTDPMPADREAVALLRRSDKPVLYVANKADSPGRALGATAHYELGLDAVLPVSALHGRGLGELEEALCRALPEPERSSEATGDDATEGVPRVAIVGRPNAGKSSLVNALAGEERQLVDARAGTTIDSVDTLVVRDGRPLVLIDTAGIRRKRAKKSGVETLSILQAIRAIERSDVVVLLIDAAAGVGEQDAKIAGLAVDRGRALVLAMNKTDLLARGEEKRAMDRAREVLAFVPWAPMVTLSATESKGIAPLLGRVHDAVDAHRTRVTTGELNRFFEQVLETHPPPSMNNRPVRLYYITQALAKPPTFIIV